jgi:hypothetical protein
MTLFRFQPRARAAALALSTVLAAGALTGCFQAKAARDLRGEYATQAYLQSVEAALATRSLATELLHHDSPETVRQRLEEGLIAALEAARTGDDGRVLADPAALQKRTIRATLWYEGERRGLENWYAAELRKIDALGKVIESTGDAALRTSRMADAELTVSEEALRSFARNRLPELAGEALKAYVATRDAGQVAEKPEAAPAPEARR